MLLPLFGYTLLSNKPTLQQFLRNDTPIECVIILEFDILALGKLEQKKDNNSVRFPIGVVSSPFINWSVTRYLKSN